MNARNTFLSPQEDPVDPTEDSSVRRRQLQGNALVHILEETQGDGGVLRTQNHTGHHRPGGYPESYRASQSWWIPRIIEVRWVPGMKEDIMHRTPGALAPL